MKLTIVLCLGGLFGLFELTAQNSSITISNNLPGTGDQLIKVELAYNASGANGTHVPWDFSKVSPVNERYESNNSDSFSKS